MATEKKTGMFSAIESRDDALKVVKDASNAFFFLAALMTAAAFVLGFSLMLDALFYAIGGYFIRSSHSRVVAVILLLLALVGIGVTVANKLGQHFGGGNNIILALIVLWVAVRTVEATFKLQGKFAEEAIE